MLPPSFPSCDKGTLILCYGQSSDVQAYARSLVLANQAIIIRPAPGHIVLVSNDGPIGVFASMALHLDEDLQEVVGRFTSYKNIPANGGPASSLSDLYAEALAGESDHFLLRRYSGLELVNLLRSNMRTSLPPSVLTAARWTLEMSSRSLLCPSHEKIPLTESQWIFTSALKRHSPNKVDRRDLIQMMGYNASYYDRNRMDAMVRRLRHKILATTATVNPIQTVHGIGYVWRE
jgi:hypothetical protein